MYPGAIAERTPDKPAWVMAGSEEVVTYQELEDRSNQLAQLLRARGLGPGDHLAILMENHARYLEVCWAAQRSGLYYTAISSRLTAPEAGYILDDCGATALVTSRALAEVAAAAVTRAPRVTTRLMVGGAAPGFEAYEAALGGQPATPVPDQSEGADLLYSSGTTGRPRGIERPLPGLPLGTPGGVYLVLTGLYGLEDNSVYLSPAPQYHAAPLRFCLEATRAGATVVVMEHFDPEAYLAAIERCRATHSQLVPTMFVRLLKLPEETRRRYDVGSLRCAIHAAAPCPVPVKAAMIEWWGPIIHEYYAGTEGNGFVTISSEQWLAHPGSVGRPLIGAVHIADEAGRELAPGKTGTVWFEGAAPFRYRNDPGKTAATYNDVGWSTLGDVGHVDEEGWLYLTDRLAFTIISGGVNVYPQEAENALVVHPKVADAAVFGVPSEDLGEEVKAVVQPVTMDEAGSELEAELLAWCRARLADVKCPRSIDFEPELPRHPTGKLYKQKLRDRYWPERGSRIG